MCTDVSQCHHSIMIISAVRHSDPTASTHAQHNSYYHYYQNRYRQQGFLSSKEAQEKVDLKHYPNKPHSQTPPQTSCTTPQCLEHHLYVQHHNALKQQTHSSKLFPSKPIHTTTLCCTITHVWAMTYKIQLLLIM